MQPFFQFLALKHCQVVATVVANAQLLILYTDKLRKFSIAKLPGVGANFWIVASAIINLQNQIFSKVKKHPLFFHKTQSASHANGLISA